MLLPGPALQDGQVADRGVSRLVEDVGDAGEESVHRALQAVAAQRPEDALQLGVGLLDGVGVGLVALGVAQPLFQEVVDLLGDRLDLDAGAQQQVPVLLRGGGLRLTSSRM